MTNDKRDNVILWAYAILSVALIILLGCLSCESAEFGFGDDAPLKLKREVRAILAQRSDGPWNEVKIYDGNAPGVGDAKQKGVICFGWTTLKPFTNGNTGGIELIPVYAEITRKQWCVVWLIFDAYDRPCITFVADQWVWLHKNYRIADVVNKELDAAIAGR